jgi:hypothetical protein
MDRPIYGLDIPGQEERVIRNEGPYVKLLTNPRWNFTDNRWEAVAQVDGTIAVIEVNVSRQEAE